MTAPNTPLVTVEARAERHLIRPGGSFRHVLFTVRVGPRPAGTTTRTPVALGLVLDRSGSMQGEKLDVAREAALAVLDRLGETDEVALTIFDHEVEVIQPRTGVTGAVRERLRARLLQIRARGNTALHEGWLSGCRALAATALSDDDRSLSRCFLLTDGLANAGVTDPEQIATEAAGIRAHAGIATSTFGVGPDYDEGLLGPMAEAGGGRFHHLRTASEIASTFTGELGELFAVAARNVRLRVEVDASVGAETVSAYRPDATAPQGQTVAYQLDLGDLMYGEERHVVVRFAFPAQGTSSAQVVDGQPGQQVRTGVTWSQQDDEHARVATVSPLTFRYAPNAACDAERQDAAVMHWVGLHHADRARLRAAAQSKRGDLSGARHTLRSVAHHIEGYAGADDDLVAALDELNVVEREVTAAPASSMVAKELIAESYRRSRGARDVR